MRYYHKLSEIDDVIAEYLVKRLAMVDKIIGGE